MLSRSSAETEYCGAANTIAETCWLQNLLRELHTPGLLLRMYTVIMFEFFMFLLVISMQTFSLNDCLEHCLRNFTPV
ncbi:hypothetical protein Tco_0639262 [Tanacetum coccineum]